jgi:c-di-GMP-binding flagellar brake protein YcgR
MQQSYRNHLEEIPGRFNLTAGMPVEVEWIGAQGETGRFKSSITGVGSRGIALDMTTMPAGLEVNQTMRFLIAFKHQDSLYGFESFINGPPKYPHLILQAPKQFYRIQRRNYFRLSVEIPLTYCIVEKEKEDPPVWHNGVIEELSAVGLRMRSAMSMPPDTPVILKFDIPTLATPVLINGIVLRVVRHSFGNVQLVAIYPEISPKLREVIIQYLIAEQRALLREKKTL